MNHRTPQHPIKEWFNRHAILTPFVVLALAVALAFWLDAKNTQADAEERCKAGVDSRNVQRALVQEIYKLNLSFIDPKVKYTKDELKRIDKFVSDINQFRNRMYAQIGPSAPCEPYVEDDNVKPPTTPRIPKLQEGSRR
jgi:hypothetical protein